MSEGNGASERRNVTTGSVGGLSDQAVRAALGEHFTTSWRRAGQSRAEGLVTGATDERSADDDRASPWTQGLHMEVRARGALISRDRELHRAVGHDGYSNQVYGNRHVKSGYEHSVYSKDRVVVVQGMEGLGSDVLPDVKFGRDRLDVAEDATLEFKARTTLMSGTLTRRFLGGFIKAAPMEGVICGGAFVRTIGGPSANLSGLATGDVYGGAARAALSRTRIALVHYRAAHFAAWFSVFHGRTANFVITPIVSTRQQESRSGAARKLARLSKALNVARMFCPLLDIASGVIGLVGGLGFGLFKLIRNKIKGKPPPPPTETVPRVRTPVRSMALQTFASKFYS